MDSIDILGVIFQSINFIIFIPLIIYFLHEFSKYRNETLMKYRSNILLYIIHFIVLFCLIVERLYMCLVRIWQIIDIPIWTVYCLLSLTWWSSMYLFSIKVYLLYYKQKYTLSIADVSWRKDINPNEENWYIKNKNKYGNPIYLIKLAIIPYILSVFLESFVPYIAG